MQQRPDLFESELLAQRRDRAMACGFVDGADFLFRAVAAQIADRLADVTREFSSIAITGTGAGCVGAALPLSVASVVQTDPSERMLRAAVDLIPNSETRALAGETLPLAESAHDLAISVFLMHGLNDPVGHLVQLRRALKPDGLMIAALFGGQTLVELRSSLAEAEVEICGGLSPRVAPMAELRDLGGLLQRAGFAIPVADSERFDVTYASMFELMRELRAMGETNILAQRRRTTLRRDVLYRASEIYQRHFGVGDGRVRATFEVVFLTGWAPAHDQPKALRPGSAKIRLADALGTVEISAGERAGED